MIEYCIRQNRKKIELTEEQYKDMQLFLAGKVDLENLSLANDPLPPEIKNIPEVNQRELNERGQTTYCFSTLTEVTILNKPSMQPFKKTNSGYK